MKSAVKNNQLKTRWNKYVRGAGGDFPRQVVFMLHKETIE